MGDDDWWKARRAIEDAVVKPGRTTSEAELRRVAEIYTENEASGSPRLAVEKIMGYPSTRTASRRIARRPATPGSCRGTEGRSSGEHHEASERPLSSPQPGQLRSGAARGTSSARPTARSGSTPSQRLSSRDLRGPEDGPRDGRGVVRRYRPAILLGAFAGLTARRDLRPPRRRRRLPARRDPARRCNTRTSR